MTLSLGDYAAQIVNMDFQRSNMFSVVIATRPSSKSANLLDAYTTTTTLESIRSGSSSSISNGVKKIIGAMTERLAQSLLGEYKVGSYILDFFNINTSSTTARSANTDLQVYSIKIPENRINHEIDKTYNAPNIKITGREFEPLTISFRMDPEAANYRAMHDWVNAVEDPINGLRALPADVEADIQANLHARNGLPHTTFMFTGCIPVGISSPELSYDNDNQIATFDVTFAYRSMQIGAIAADQASNWLVSTNLFGTLGQYDIRMNATDSGSRLS